MEELRHMLGLCGEPHPSLIWLLASGGTLLYMIKHNIKWCWNRGCDICKDKIFKTKKK